MVTIKGLSMQYSKNDSPSLTDINLQVESGLFGLLGNNGAGKSTLMNIISTLLIPTSGSVEINGIVLERKTFREIRNKVGYMSQENGMYPNFSCYEALEYFSILNSVPKASTKDKINELLEYVNLQEQRNKKYKNLSGGMKRRLALAIALVNNPEIILVDEPTTGVDPIERIRMRNLLMKLAEQKTVILSTHIIEDIAYTCKMLGVLSSGRLLYKGSIEKLISLTSGKIWSYSTANEAEKTEIINSKNVISVNHIEGCYQLKILSSTVPITTAVEILPSLEDSFIALESGE